MIVLARPGVMDHAQTGHCIAFLRRLKRSEILAKYRSRASITHNGSLRRLQRGQCVSYAGSPICHAVAAGHHVNLSHSAGHYHELTTLPYVNTKTQKLTAATTFSHRPRRSHS